MAKEDSKKDMAQDKKMAKKAIGMHDKQMHGGKKTDLTALKKGGGVKKMLGGGLSAALGKGVANAVKQNPNMGGTASLGGMGRRGAPMPQQSAAGKAAQQATIMAQQNRGQLPQKPAGLGSLVKGSTGPGTISRANMPNKSDLGRAAAAAGPATTPSALPSMNNVGSIGNARMGAMKKGGSVSSRADGCVKRGKTKGKII
jgi:hypothetical protein